MANINTQSRLEEVALKERKELLLKTNLKSSYSKESPYSENHKDAISDGDALGKGTRNGGHSYNIPDRNKPTTLIDYSTFDTTDGGGKYDIEGTDGVQGAFQGPSGRNFAKRINLYSAENSYGPNSVDTSANVMDGQYVVK